MCWFGKHRSINKLSKQAATLNSGNRSTKSLVRQDTHFATPKTMKALRENEWLRESLDLTRPNNFMLGPVSHYAWWACRFYHVAFCQKKPHNVRIYSQMFGEMACA
ncbi:hypothetical protein PHLCEN_2v11804 [Hermanssonia centrifuga]|uniref:Uncharacterized protein n=1 Tax=Hermanssonia centrifuga TaxID=98765 RepID=A0A2R6NIW0_9APHY|nr:hypothetical protein PHLCEN_2v11804 [Hermanssonia centrifuga]